MWEYKIYKTSLGWSIYRREYSGKLVSVQFLNGYNMWTTNKDHAKIFYNVEDATSALVIEKSKSGKETPTTSIEKSGSEGKGERTSWSELS